jgi:hypothetical protein
MAQAHSLLTSPKLKAVYIVVGIAIGYKCFKGIHSKQPSPAKDNRVGVNAKFFAQVKKLLPIVIPGMYLQL